MAHIFLIDPLEKLVPKKDSTILLALTLQSRGHQVYFLFEDDVFLTNKQSETLNIYEFSGKIGDDFYLYNVKLEKKVSYKLSELDCVHMRLDPPFDMRYLRFLWILAQWEKRGVRVLNAPEGIMVRNEKIRALEDSTSLNSYVGKDSSSFEEFINNLKADGVKEIIIKPLDLYQGIGVLKVDISASKAFEDVLEAFLDSTRQFGTVVCQPFEESVRHGELRSVYFNSQLIGAIKKIPPQGEFLANVAQGATFFEVSVPDDINQSCLKICDNLREDGIYWVAFDVLGNAVSEVNVTCPGLLVELSHAHNRNLALDISNSLEKI